MFKVIWVAGMPRSGSMWTYNVVRELAKRAGYRVLPDEVFISDEDSYAYAVRETAACQDSRTIFVLKIHACINAIPPSHFVITNLRDARDAVMSYMRFMQVDFDQALAANRVNVTIADHYQRFPEEQRMVLRYEDLRTSPIATVAGIAERIGLGVEEGAAEEIASQFSKEKVRALIETRDRRYREAAESRQPLVGEVLLHRAGGGIATFDRATGFQSDHVSDYEDGTWRELLSEEQVATMNAVFGTWLARNGYTTQPATI